ncbi:glycosyltransferase WbuB [Paenibacillus sp. 7884-2]|nr:glycosyltransferase WbuB [Paenibacillus sp. 7884-2]
MSKRVLIITQNFYPEIGSAGNRMKNIYLLLQDKGFDVDVLTTDPTYPTKKIYDDSQFWDHDGLNNDALHIERVKMKNKKYSRSILKRLMYYLEMAIKMFFSVVKSRKKYDIVYTTSPAIFIAIVGLIAKIKYKSRLILEIRDLWPESLKGVGVFDKPIILKVFKEIENLLYKKADSIVVNSEGFIDYIKKQSDQFEGKITYIPNGARMHELSMNNESVGPFKVIYAGNIGLAQDDEILMQLAKELNKKNIEFTIIGYGIRRQGLQDYIHKENLQNVTFLKPLSRKECLQIIAEHHVGVVTLAEKDVFKTVLPGKIIDYMSCGIPIVASVSGFAKKVIMEENAGFVSEENNASELLKYIDIFYQNPELRDEIGNNALTYVKERFLWESNIESLVKVMNNNI